MMRNHWLMIGATCLVLGGARARPAGAAESKGPSTLDAQALAATIDRLLAAKWAEAKVEPSAPADDAEFLRRVYLDLVGKVPTVSEAIDFIDDPAPDKRARLVETLLDSSAYLTRATETYRALLLPEADTDAQVRQLAPTFEAWLRKRVSDNVGYDKLVRELLTLPLGGRGRRAGNALDPKAEPSPLAFYVARGGKPEDLGAGTARVFLGIRLECAQCHNHPFARWKREQFWGLAAFFAGVSKQGKDDALGPIRETGNQHELAVPGMAPAKIVSATFLDGIAPKFGARSSGRELLADWVAAPDNPYFARAAVNRVWARFFGVGLVEPVDDMGDDNPPAIPELLDELAGQFRSHGYDLKFLVRTLTATRAYGLTSGMSRSEPPPAALFAVMPVRSLSPGQLFETLAQATGFRDPSGNGFAFGFDGAPKAQFLELFANRDEKPTEGQTTILQALALMNGPLMASVTTMQTGDTLAALAEAPFLDTSSRIERLYLATLTRRPRPHELATMVTYVDRGPAAEAKTQALADVFWALLNSPEFRFNH